MAASGTVSTTLSEWLLVALILFSLVLELMLHRLEHWIAHRHHHLVSVVRVLYRELMVLGLISFIFILFETLSKPSGTVVLSFEFAHVFIFLLAVFYALVVLSTMFLSLRLSSRWKSMERMDVVNYLTTKSEYALLREKVLRRPDAIWRVFWWFPNVPKLYRYIRLHEVITFHDTRFQFIYFRNLPEDFRFSSFLRKIKSITFIDLVESHWSIHLIFLAVLLADIARRYIISDQDPLNPVRAVETDDADDASDGMGFETTECVFIIVAAIFTSIFVQSLSTKIRRIYWELTKHPRLYYDGVDAEHFEEELQKAVSDRKRRREDSTSTTAIPHPDTGDEADDESDPTTPTTTATPQSDSISPVLDTPSSPNVAELPAPNEPLTPSPVPTSESEERPASIEVVMPVSPASPMTPRHLWSSPLSPTCASPRTGRPYRLPLEEEQRAKTDFHLQLPGRRGSTLSHHPGSLMPRNNSADSFALENMIARHSLDAPRGAMFANLASPRGPPPGVPSVEASIGRAALEAARKRSVPGKATSPRQQTAESPSQIRSPLANPYRRAPITVNSIGASRSSNDKRRRRRRESIELAVVVGRDELAAQLENRSANVTFDLDTESRFVSGKSWSRDVSSTGTRIETGNGEIRLDVTMQSAETGAEGVDTVNMTVNPTIMNNLEHQRIAQNSTPARYPRWLTWLIPRLGRVASPVEKLFWFGSHRLFLWCVEFVLFFSTVLLAAAASGLSLMAVSGREIDVHMMVAMTFGVVNLLFVLLKTAGILKRYIFILHNASLIPEVVALEAIQNVRDKHVEPDDGSSASGSDMERDDGDAARERRRRLGRFFRDEAEIGNVAGIESGSARRTRRESSLRRRFRERSRRRRRREAEA